jgi:hypothetical protein
VLELFEDEPLEDELSCASVVAGVAVAPVPGAVVLVGVVVLVKDVVLDGSLVAVAPGEEGGSNSHVPLTQSAGEVALTM